jgi:cell division protein FtsI/penicillin-binding protein 2
MRPTLELGRPLDTMRWRFGAENAAFIHELMREPLLPGGTAAGAFPGFDARGITVFGKTGTADREPDGREPSWFISYAEKNGRRYAVCVAIQDRNGQYAGALNAPIARRVYEALDSYGYFVPATRAAAATPKKRR